MSKLPYGRQTIEQDDIDAVVKTLRGDWLTQGPSVDAFERELVEISGARFAVAVANGTAALHLACIAGGLKHGDIALVPDITFVATANAVRYVGAVPQLVDVDPSTALIDVEQTHSLLRRNPRAILPVSFAGSVAPLERIHALAAQTDALVIEDASHSLGATYTAGGTVRRSGSCAHSQMATFSFHAVKHITTGEGGAITTNDETLYRLLLELRTHGITRDAARLETTDGPWYYEQHGLGFNYRLTDIQSALGCSQAKKLPRFVDARRALARRYDEHFADLRDRATPLRQSPTSVYHLYVMRLAARPRESLESVAARRKSLYLALRENDIFAQVHYIPIHRQPDFVRAGLAGGEFVGALEYYAGCLSLPLFPSMTGDDVDRVMSVVRSTLGSN